MAAQDPGINYQLEAIQGLGLQVELLSRHGYADAWTWSNSALRRMAAVVTRSGSSGGTGWNETQTARQMPWLLDQRYGLSIARQHAPMGRAIGFTDWLYGWRRLGRQQRRHARPDAETDADHVGPRRQVHVVRPVQDGDRPDERRARPHGVEAPEQQQSPQALRPAASPRVGLLVLPPARVISLDIPLAHVDQR